MKRLMLLVLMLMFAAVVQGQTGAGINGRVTDQRNANVVDAHLRLTSRTGARFVTVSDDNGQYAFKNVPDGDYVLEVHAEGFATFSSKPFALRRGQSTTTDVQLSVETVNENVVITATGTSQTIDETAKAVTTLDGQAIEARREIALPEAVRGIPGVRVQQQGSLGSLTSIRLRGLRNFDTAISLDGLRVRDAGDPNGSAVPLIPDLLTDGFDRVEMLRGSGSSIYGTNAIGGVINLVPTTGAGSSHFEFGFEGGSRALFRERIKGAGGLGDRSGYSFALTRLDVRHGVDGNDPYGNTLGSGRWQFAPTPKILISSNFYGIIANSRVNDDPIPLAAAFTRPGPYPDAIPGVTYRPDIDNPDAGRRNRTFVWSGKLSQQVNDRFSYSVAYQHVGARRRNYDGPLHGPKDTSQFPFGDFVFMSVNNGSTDTVDARMNWQAGRYHLVTAGTEFERESLFQFFQQDSVPPTTSTDRQRTFAVFGQDQLSLLQDRLQLSFGIRTQSFQIRAADRPGFLSAITPRRSWTGDGSVGYFIRSTNTKLRAHAGNGFRAPSLFERFGFGTFSGMSIRFGDPTLRAEQSISVDAGVDQRVARDRARLGATYFYTRLQRVISFAFAVPDPLGLKRFSLYQNQPGGISRGIETYLESAPWRNAQLNASYTYTNSDRYVSNQFAAMRGLQREYVIPKHLLGLTFSQRYRSFAFNFDLNRTGSYIAPIFEVVLPFRTAELTFPGYTKADLFTSYERRVTERATLTFFGGADNLFDAKYFENGFRAPGITARGGILVRFK